MNRIRQRPSRGSGMTTEMISPSEQPSSAMSISNNLPSRTEQGEENGYSNSESTSLYSHVEEERVLHATILEQDPLVISIDDAIDRIGMGRFQIQIMVAAGLCFASDACEILLLSFLSLVLLVEWDLTDRQASSITSSVFAGAFLGTLILGRLGDRWGRRPVFLLTASMIACFGLATALVRNYNELILFRFLIGFGVGGIVVPFDTLAEFMPTHARGQQLVTTSYFWTTATLLVPILAYFTLGRSQSASSNDKGAATDAAADADSNWRLFVACCAIPCTVSTIVGTYAVPESPRWLLLKGEDARALQVLRQAAATNGKDPLVVFPAGTQLLGVHTTDGATFCDLLSTEWLRTTLLLWCLWGCYAFLYYGTIIAVALVFSKAPTTHDTTSDSNHQRYHFDFLGMIVSSSAEIAGVLCVSRTVDRFGRINCMSAYFLLGGMFILALCLLEEVQSATSNGDYRMELIVLAFFARMFVYSGSSIVWITTAEILTTEIRATGHSVANAVARIGAFAAPYLVSPSEKPSTIGITMFVGSLLIVACARSLPETAGKPLGTVHDQADQRSQGRRAPTEENTII